MFYLCRRDLLKLIGVREFSSEATFQDPCQSFLLPEVCGHTTDSYIDYSNTYTCIPYSTKFLRRTHFAFFVDWAATANIKHTIFPVNIHYTKVALIRENYFYKTSVVTNLQNVCALTICRYQWEEIP